VVVGQVASDSSADDLGIQPNDVIVSVDQRPVTTPESAAAQLKTDGSRHVLLPLNCHGMGRFVGLSVGERRTPESQAAAAECAINNSAGDT
jgi:S1-C subfamily serine protease